MNANKTAAVDLPKATFSSLFNPFDPTPWSPEFLRKWVGGDYKKQLWAGKMQQAVNLAAVLFTMGYGSRKMLRGMSPEMQSALKAIDEYVPSSVAKSPADNKRLVDVRKTRAQRKAEKEQELANLPVADKGVKMATDLNNFAYVLPPAAAFMAWMVGQKMAENEVRATDLSDSEARLAKARYDYDRVLASKIDPNVQLPEKRIKKRFQNPLDWTIDKGILLKNKMMGKKESGEEHYTTDRTDIPSPYPHGRASESNNLFSAYLRPFADWFEERTGMKPWLTVLGALVAAGSAKYAWNNNRARDKNIQKALDTEAALKQHALEVNDQRLDISALTGKPDEKKLNTYPGALGFEA